MADLGENIKFEKETGEVLEVNQEYVGIKSREDNFMSISFRVPQEDVNVIQHYFQNFALIEPFKIDICDTGNIPVFFRGITPVIEKNENGNHYFFMALTVQESVKTAEQVEEEALCQECTGCGIHTDIPDNTRNLI